MNHEIKNVGYFFFQKHIYNTLILVSATGIILVLLALKIPNAVYQQGMSAFSWLLTPATVCFALPLYRQVKVLIKNLHAILAGVLSGTVTRLVSVFLLGRLFRMDRTMMISLLRKSVTTATGAPVSEAMGGVGSITVAAIIATGIWGSVLGPALCRWFRIADHIAWGTAIGKRPL